MIKIKYRTQLGEIKPIEVAGETNALVITQQGRRGRKRGEWSNWHNTWEDAHAFLIDRAEKKVTEAKGRLAVVEDELARIKAMVKDGLKSTQNGERKYD